MRRVEAGIPMKIEVIKVRSNKSMDNNLKVGLREIKGKITKNVKKKNIDDLRIERTVKNNFKI